MQNFLSFKKHGRLTAMRKRRCQTFQPLTTLVVLTLVVGGVPILGLATPETLASTSLYAQSTYQPGALIAQSNLPAPRDSSQSPARPGGERLSEADDKAEILVQPEDDGVFASVFSSTGLLVVLALGAFAILVSRKARSQGNLEGEAKAPARELLDESKGVESESGQSVSVSNQSSPPKGGSGVINGSIKTRRPATQFNAATPDSLYGAYRIDQEVGKLVLAQPHRTDVLSSRAPDDRRAIESSLVKIIQSRSDENEQRRARQALEEYGFVARECAALLLAADAFERTSAARTLGQIKSASALPFLLEALYDHESIVRNQVVESIGELRLPKAIGALLNVAGQHPDVPPSLLRRVLSACSVEGLDVFEGILQDWLAEGELGSFFKEINQLRSPLLVEDLPENADDEILIGLLSQIQSQDPAMRAEATKALAEYRVGSSVVALSSRARRDPEPAVRSQAILSLTEIDHESVFPAVLIGMADESREVRAAAARSLSRLSFDRTDAYARLVNTADDDLLFEVASACIKAGIVSQGIDRLSGGDRRQAFETFSIVSLLAKAKLTDSFVEAISSHANTDVRLAAVRLLASMPQPEIVGQLRKLALKPDMSEDVRTELLEALYRVDQENLGNEALLTILDAEEELGFSADSAPNVTGGFEIEPCIELNTTRPD
jgi:HEAT repeat protein